MAKLRNINRSLPMQLLLARESTMSLFRPMLRSFGLTDQQWRVLRVLKNLEEDRLVKRTTVSEDQRKVLITLTAKGNRKYKQVVPESEKIYRSIENKLGKRELDDLLKQLVTLNKNLEN